MRCGLRIYRPSQKYYPVTFPLEENGAPKNGIDIFHVYHYRLSRQISSVEVDRVASAETV